MFCHLLVSFRLSFFFLFLLDLFVPFLSNRLCTDDFLAFLLLFSHIFYSFNLLGVSYGFSLPFIYLALLNFTLTCWW